MGIWEPVWNNFWSADEFNKYPLYMTTPPHSVHRQWDQFDMNPQIGDSTDFESDSVHKGDVYGNNALKMSAADAQMRGINDGDRVRVYNDAGQVVVKYR